MDISGASASGEQAEESRKQDHIGQQFGNYHVLRLLGRGGTASVYLGEHVYLKSHAALKILHIQLTEGGAEQFLQEAQTLARLSHPHIVRVLDFAVQDSIPFLVMDYAIGGNLRQRHSAGTRLPLDTVVSYVQQLASALQYAHDHRLIHCDIKPENMLLSSRDDLLLSDFGLALFAPSTNSYSTHAMAQQVAGTSLYLAPEQLQGRPLCASDQYAFAVVVYEWLCGTTPFKGTPLEIAIKHISVPPPPLHSQVSDLSPALEEVVLRALAKEPEQRFATVQEFALALQQATHGSVQHTITGGGKLPHSTPRDHPCPYHQYSTSTREPIWRVPTVWTPLIGREQEVAATCALLLRPELRLLTLLGTGGIGKTRLSIQVANELRTGFADGVCFVSLATIQNPDQVMPSIARELDLQAKDTCPFEQLKNFLCEKHLLLILDNFEQVIQAALSIEHLLGACPHVKVFVTSRVALHIQGEQRLALHPLALPDLKRLPEKEAIAHYASVALFVQCAQARIPSFDVTSTNAATLAEICVRLDGLPLAIELAAARIKLLPPQALLPRLAHRLQVLTGGAATLPNRQQTLRSTIQWSYDLLEPWEQQLFRRLAVFVGGCNLQAVEALYAAFARRGRFIVPIADLSASGNPGAESVLDVVDSLIEKSLLQVSTDVLDQSGGRDQSGPYGQEEEPRLSMLETIREYALECLAANGELEVTREVHADYYLALAAEVEPKLGGPDQAAWLDQLEREHDNLRAALQWSLERGEAEHCMEMALQFGGVLRRFWLVHGHLNEGRIFLERALARSEGTTASVRAKALNSAANIALNQGYVDRAEVFAEESLALYRELGDTRGIAFSFHQLERVARARGNLRASRSMSEEALALFKEVGDKERVAWSLFRLARLHREQGEYSRAYALAEESLVVHRELGNKEGIASSLFQLAHVLFASQGDQARVHCLLEECLALYRELGDKEDMADCFYLSSQVALSRGDTATARSLAEESVVLSREIGDREGIAESLPLLARVLAVQGNHSAARALYKESLALVREMGNKMNIAICLEGLADVAMAEMCPTINRDTCPPGRVPTEASLWAIQLWGAAQSLRQAIGAPIPPVDRATYERSVATARAQLGEKAFTKAWAEGQTMILEQILAVQEPTTRPEQVPRVARIEASSPTNGGKLASLRSTPAPTAKTAPIYPAGLTTREVEVLRLVAQGLTDAQVAEQLVISPRTVNFHLTSIYSKLGVSSRAAATRYAMDHHLV